MRDWHDVFDEETYLDLNPDVRSAVEAGQFISAMEHYELCGRFENRTGIPPLNFDEAYYLENNLDVKAQVSANIIPSGAHHYITMGQAQRKRIRKACSSRQHLLDKVCYGVDPFEGFPSNVYTVDTQGWNSDHPFLTDCIKLVKPRLIVEVGVWKGASVITMANYLSEQSMDCAILAVDTWLGSSEHWLKPSLFTELGVVHGYPKLYYKFMSNMVAAYVSDYVVPLPLDSMNARVLCANAKLQADIVHIDAGHDYDSVRNDLEGWWERLGPGGALIADDYYPGESWPGVERAVDEFALKHTESEFLASAGKAMLRKLH